MNFGFIRVAAAIPRVEVANCSFNRDQIAGLMDKAARKGVQVLCFPELCITGYTCGDLFRQRILLDEAREALSFLLRASEHHAMLVVVGMPLREGNLLFNTAVVMQAGTLLGVVPKSYLPNYGEFYEKRWFAPGSMATQGSVPLCGQWVPFGTDLLFRSEELCLGVEICEDLWGPVPPSSLMAKAGAQVLCNISASNELTGKNSYLQSLITQQSARCVAGYLYASCGYGESTTDVVFAGNGYIAENGQMLCSSERFQREEQLISTEIDIERLMAERAGNLSFSEPGAGEAQNIFRVIPFELSATEAVAKPGHEAATEAWAAPEPEPGSAPGSMTGTEPWVLTRPVSPMPFIPQAHVLSERCQEIISIQVSGLAKRLEHTGMKKVMVGVSGGLDSTLALLVAVKTVEELGLPNSGVLGLTMPGLGTSDRTYRNAVALIGQLGATFREIPIREACLQHFKDIGHDPLVHDTTYENVQARERTQILMDLANQEQALVLGTGDMSELALGWTTYNGDHMSMYGINSGIPKTLVRHLVQWFHSQSADKKVCGLLADILDTPVSPELLPALENGEISQRTEDLAGPYELHDFFLFYTLRYGFRPAKIYFLAKAAFGDRYGTDVLRKWLRVFFVRFFAQQFKRSCMPDGPKIGSVCLSPRGDWRMPSDASPQLWLEEIDQLM
jgi:NAD+ synthase (glutamine-hydrolysing)